MTIDYQPLTDEYAVIDDLIVNGLREWVLYGRRPGGFLQAVLRNDFKSAVARADAHNILLLKEIMFYLVNRMPHGSQGSPEAVYEWESHDGLTGLYDNAELVAVARDAGDIVAGTPLGDV